MSQNVYLTTSVSITLDDNKERQLRYTMGSLKRFKDATGKSLFDVFTAAATGTEFVELLPLIIHVGLVKPDITADEVADLITLPMLETLAMQVGAAFSGSMPEPANGKESRPTTEPAKSN